MNVAQCSCGKHWIVSAKETADENVTGEIPVRNQPACFNSFAKIWFPLKSIEKKAEIELQPTQCSLVTCCTWLRQWYCLSLPAVTENAPKACRGLLLLVNHLNHLEILHASLPFMLNGGLTLRSSIPWREFPSIIWTVAATVTSSGAVHAILRHWKTGLESPRHLVTGLLSALALAAPAVKKTYILYETHLDSSPECSLCISKKPHTPARTRANHLCTHRLLFIWIFHRVANIWDSLSVLLWLKPGFKCDLH